MKFYHYVAIAAIFCLIVYLAAINGFFMQQ